MDADEDISSPKVQRKMWRRVWIGLAIFVIVTPVLLWVAIDQGGKREWKRVQAELRAKGEATTIAELRLPTRHEIPDEDNFGAVECLQAKENGTESAAMAELLERLNLFSYYDSDIREDLFWSKGNPFIGRPGDVELRADILDIAAREQKVEITLSDQANGVEKMQAYLDLHADIWSALTAAEGREFAQAVPLLSERLALGEHPSQISFPHFRTIQKIVITGRWRALCAAAEGDGEAFVNFFQVSSRLTEMAANEQVLIGTLVAVTETAVTTSAFAEGLWNERLRLSLDANQFQTLQATWQRTDFRRMMQRTQPTEFAWLADSIMLFPEHRRELIAEWGGHGPPSWLLSVAPVGWFANNTAYLGDSYERYLFEPLRRGANFAELIDSARDWRTEVDGLNQLSKTNYSMALMSSGTATKILSRVAYAEARRRQAIIVCALHRYRLEHEDGFPDTLKRLVPTYLDAVPLDPIDGTPMRYALSDDPGGFQLWSIGFDRTDNNGALNLLSEEPEKTRLERDSYFGDWPWLNKPHEFVRPNLEK